MKAMFPTIDFGKGKTFANLLFHIAELKRSLILKIKRNVNTIKIYEEKETLRIKNAPHSKPSTM